MDTVTLRLKVVTPMFLGGALLERQAEIRAPSIKGALRFWYRAIDPEYLEHEARIFGGSAAKEGQSCFLLRVSDILEPTKKHHKDGEAGDLRWDGTKIAYLGYGPINRAKTGRVFKDKGGKERPEQKAMTLRPYIRSGTQFSLSLHFKPHTPAADVMRVKKALWALVMLGGLGARSRKGFGSLVVVNEPIAMGDLPPMQSNGADELVAHIRAFLEQLTVPERLPEYSSWSGHAKCVVTGEGATGEAALEWLGNQMHACRSWKGDKKQIWVKGDHDLMRNFLATGKWPKPPVPPPLRSTFGLPHSYFFRSLGNKRGGIDWMEGNKPGRRASPLIVHIHEFEAGVGSDKARVIATYLPARLIPQGGRVRISSDRGRTHVALPNDFTAVTDFLERLISKGRQVS